MAPAKLLARLTPSAALLTVTLAVSPASAQEERPSAMQLFPKETVLWLRTADARLLVERYQDTEFGRMFRDPEMQGLVEAAYGAATDAYDEFGRELLETDLNDLLSLPQGEIAFGVIHRQNDRPGVLLIADFGENSGTAMNVIERLERLAEERTGALVSTEQLRSDEATIVRDGNNQSQSVGIVNRENTFVIANDPEVLQGVLDRWDGIPLEERGFAAAEDDLSEEGENDEDEPATPRYAEPLADNAAFSATLRELMPGGEEPPQALAFVDPIGMVEAFGGRSTGVRIAMATFPSLGLNGIKGLGGAMWFATDKWDSLARGHLLLKNPRAGVVKIARLETGLTAPPSYVPAGIENFLSVRVNPTRMFEDISGIYDRFQYDGAFRSLVEKNLSTPMDIDFEQQFVGNLDGSLFYVTGYAEDTSRVAAVPAIGMGVLDVAAAREMLETWRNKFPEALVEDTFGETTYWSFTPPRFRDRPPEEMPPNVPTPCFGVIGETLVFCETTPFFKQLIETHDGQRDRLADDLQYRLVRGRLERLTKGQPFSAFGFHDIEPMIRNLHARAESDESREQLDQIAERVEFFGRVRDVLDESEIPSLETLLKYSSPSGSVMIDTPTGWHMISFSFKRSGE